MAEVDISVKIQLLKDDLAAISSLGYNEKTEHLNQVSKPLIRTIFQLLSQEIEELPTNQITSLCDYLVHYLGLDHDIAIESLMCLYKLKIEDNLHDILNDQIDNLLQLQSTKFESFKLIKIVSHLFTFDPVLSSEIFNKNALFINLVTNETTNLSNKFDDAPNTEFINNLNYLLVLFSNACVDEISRSLIASMYFNVILKCLSSTKIELQQCKCYATTITIKLWRLIKPETLDNNSQLLSLNNLLEANLQSLEHSLTGSVEGLSLLCTNIMIKQKVRNEKILNILFDLLEEKEHLKYGIITILSLFTLPNRVMQIKQRSIMTLKDSNSISNIDIITNKRLNNSKVDDDENQINYVITELIKRKFISKKLTLIFKSLESSKGLVGECIKLMLNVIFPDSAYNNFQRDLYNDKEFQTLYTIEIKQIIKLLTAYLIGTSQNIKYNQVSFIKFNIESMEFPEEELAIRSIAIKALTSPNISVHIKKIYKDDDEYSQEFATSPLPFIMEILVQHVIDLGISVESKKTPFTSLKRQLFTNFDVYYAITSLGALASLGYKKVKEIIFMFSFDSIIDLLSSDDWKIQFSCLQLLNQISDVPLCLAKIFNWENEENSKYQNFAILCYLILSEKPEIQKLALSFFYSCSRFDIISSKLATSDLFCKNLSKLISISNLEQNLQYYAILILSIILPLKESEPDNKLDVFKDNKSLIVELSDEDNEVGEVASAVLAYF